MTAAPRSTARFDVSGDRVDVAVVVVTYRSATTIGRLLESLREATDGLRLAVVVVDNASSDATCAVVRRYPDVQLVEAGANIGYGAGINRGVAAAPQAEVLLVLNPDLAVERDTVAALVAQLAADDSVGIAVPALYAGDGSRSVSLRREPTVLRTLGDALLGARWRDRPAALGETIHDDEAYCADADIEWATGAAYAISSRCARDVGAWDERFFLYSEEVDFARRARDRDWRVRYVSDAIAVHDGGGSGSSPALDALLAISRVRYMIKHRGRGAAAATWGVLLLGQVLRVLRSGGPERVGLLAAPWRWNRLVPERLGGARTTT